MLPHVKVNKMDVIDTNVYENFYETAGHLLDIGYNGVVYIDGPQKYYRQKERIRGIQSAYDEHGLEWKEEYQIFAETWGIEPIKQAVLEWMKENHKPNAFLCANDNHAIGALQAVQALGFNVPKDYGIVGNRNSNLSITTEPTLCSIDCHYPQLAEIAVEHLLKMIEDNRDSPISISLNGTLVIRNSIIVNS